MTPVSFWTESAGFPVLTTLAVVPVLGQVLLFYSQSAKHLIRIAISTTSVNLLLSLYLVTLFDGAKTGVQLAEHFSFFGMTYSVGVDGLNILFIPLTTCTAWLIMVYLCATRNRDNKPLLSGMLIYEAILLAAFSAFNLMQFWLVLVLELGVIIFLTTQSGLDQKKRHLLVRITQFFGSSLFLILSGFLLLAFGLVDSEHDLTFELLTLKDNNAYLHDETLIFILLFYGFAIRMPLFPFHGWLPLLAEQGGLTGLTVLIAGLKLGIYASIRFIFPLVPGVAEQWSSYVLFLCLVSIFYGALLAFMQTNIYRLLAFAIISNTGMLGLGLFSFNASGLEGSLLLCMVYGLASVGMLLSISLLYEQTGTVNIHRLGGLFDSRTTLGLLFFITAFSTMIMPGSLGFDAGHLLVEGIVEEHEWLVAVMVLTGNVLAAGFLLWAFQRIFLAAPKISRPRGAIAKASFYERVIAFVICGLHIGTGLNSMPLLNLIDQDADVLVSQYPVHSSSQGMDGGQSDASDSGQKDDLDAPNE